MFSLTSSYAMVSASCMQTEVMAQGLHCNTETKLLKHCRPVLLHTLQGNSTKALCWCILFFLVPFLIVKIRYNRFKEATKPSWKTRMKEEPGDPKLFNLLIIKHFTLRWLKSTDHTTHRQCALCSQNKEIIVHKRDTYSHRKRRVNTVKGGKFPNHVINKKCIYVYTYIKQPRLQIS